MTVFRFLYSVVFFAWAFTCSYQTIGQAFTKSVDLGVINGEQKRVRRSFSISYDQIPAHIRIDSPHMTLAEQTMDTINQQVSLKVDLDVEDRYGQHIDTLFIVSQDEFILDRYLLSYQVLTPVGDVFKSYRNEFWPFRSKEQVFNLKIGRAGDTLSATFDLLNFSGNTLDLSEVIIADSLMVSFEPQEVPHNAFTRMRLNYLTNDQSPLGFQRHTVLLIQDSDSLAFLPLQLSLLPPLSNKGPVLGMTRDELDYKVVKEGDLVSDVLLITNNGSAPLEIFKVESNCVCLEASISQLKIMPQQNAQLRLKLDTKGRDRLERKIITIFTNDPSFPAKSIVVKAHLK